MPSEKRNKKSKADQNDAMSSEPIKPISHYIEDRLELTKQLFSCLKTKQIKARLPPNLKNKSIERIQQICLDEILGISTKRLLAIINQTTCPDNTDSEGESGRVDEHISLEEISSDSEAEISKEPVPKKSKTPKEMTMLELLELQARARAIRSQLALEPVAKIELDSDDEAGENLSKDPPIKLSNDKNSVQVTKAATVPVTTKVIVEKKAKSPKRKIVTPPVDPTPTTSVKPVKLKRNYKTQSSSEQIKTSSEKPPPPPKQALLTFNFNGDSDHSRCSSPDVINMDPSPETFFISDSDDEPPVMVKSSEKQQNSISPEQEKEESKDQEVQEEGEISDCESSDEDQDSAVKSPMQPVEQLNDEENDNAVNNNDDVVHLMSDTEIELQSDKEDKEVAEPRKPVQILQENLQSDEDVVEIHNTSDNEIMNESDKSAGEAAKSSQTWEERWLSSSKTQNILKTTQLASKARSNMLKTKKSRIAIEKKKVETETAIKEKVSSLEEGSIEQFKEIREKSN